MTLHGLGAKDLLSVKFHAGSVLHVCLHQAWALFERRSISGAN